VLLFAEEFDDKINLWCGFYIVLFNWIFWFEILVILLFFWSKYLFIFWQNYLVKRCDW